MSQQINLFNPLFLKREQEWVAEQEPSCLSIVRASLSGIS